MAIVRAIQFIRRHVLQDQALMASVWGDTCICIGSRNDIVGGLSGDAGDRT